jgi:Tfp pilus assembly protein PilP
LVELVPDGNGGWLERQAVIALKESNSGEKK